MRTDRSTSPALRRNTLAACLAASLAMGSAFAAAAGNHPPANAGHVADTAAAWRPQLDPAARWPWHFQGSRLAPNGTGTIRIVGNCNDAGAGSLREAVAAAANGDTIDLTALACSTITLTSGAIDITAKDLTLQGPGQAALRVSGNNASQVFTSQKYAENLAINDLTIADGVAASGIGGCIFAGANLTLERTTVSGCVAGDASLDDAAGGGIGAFGDVLLVESTVTGNTASGLKSAYGGGVFSFKYASAVHGSRVDHNAAIGGTGKARGGGIFGSPAVAAYGARVSENEARSNDGTAYGGGMFAPGITDGGDPVAGALQSTISGNIAHSNNKWSYGGGIQTGDDFGATSGGIVLIASTLSGNTISSDCGDCWIQGGGASAFGQVYSYYSTIRDNTALSSSSSDGKAFGGGLGTLFASPGPAAGAIVLINSTASGNRAIGGGGALGRGFGGGIAALSSPFAALSSTVVHNQASHLGGGVYEGGSSMTSVISGSLVAGNEAPSGADIDTGSSGSVSFNGDHNLVMAAGPNVHLPVDTLSDDPKLLPVANNGGPTATHALAACSPAIDAGIVFPGFDFPTDQRGDPYVRKHGAAPDIGAFEWQPDPDQVFADGFEPSPCP